MLVAIILGSLVVAASLVYFGPGLCSAIYGGVRFCWREGAAFARRLGAAAAAKWAAWSDKKRELAFLEIERQEEAAHALLSSSPRWTGMAAAAMLAGMAAAPIDPPPPPPPCPPSAKSLRAALATAERKEAQAAENKELAAAIKAATKDAIADFRKAKKAPAP